MHIVFVGIGWEQLSLGQLSAIAKSRGHSTALAFSVSLFDDRCHLHIPLLAKAFDDRRDVIKKIERERPDVVVFSPLTITYQWMLGIARDVKQIWPEVKVVFGGVHTSAVPERVMANEFIDAICVGEGDVAFPLLLEAWSRKDSARMMIPNTRHRSGRGEIINGGQAESVMDLDSIPFFDKTIWEDFVRLREPYYTMASRGCPYRCAYCFHSFAGALAKPNNSPLVRYRGVDHLMAELKWAKARYGIRAVEFFDDIFPLNKPWLRKFLDEYKRHIKVPFQCFAHVHYLDEDRVRWMAEAGCFSAQIGVQSMHDEYKSRVIGRNETRADVERVIRLTRKYGIRAKLDHMLALPGEPADAQHRAFDFYADNPPYNIQTYWTNLFPGTELFKKAVEDGRLSDDEAVAIMEGKGFDVYRNGSEAPDPQMKQLYAASAVAFKWLPVLPVGLRKRVRLEDFMRLPSGVLSLLSFISEVLIGLARFSPDHMFFLRYYTLHVFRRIVGTRLAVFSPPTRVRKAAPDFPIQQHKSQTEGPAHVEILA